ncbi:MAG: glycerol-3-phosphate dehydrogenase/oxidase, partial [Armatimonadetes bacterium]|nr:glycerol-3-phosphate dehydrogenase/oxidase [Armatimonadota bacterium]
LGLVSYDLLARSDLPHRRLTPHDALERAPALRTDGLRAAYLYYDAVTDDVRLTHAVLATANRQGAITLNYVRAVALTPGPRWRVALLDGLTQRRFEIETRHVVNAAGVWAAQVAALAGAVSFRLRQSKGVHLVLDRTDLLAGAALVIPETDDGRLAFLVPWRGRLLLGTTDEPYDGDPAGPRTGLADARYLLTHLNRYLRSPVGPVAVTGGWAGLRPLISRGDARPADLSREHEVVEHDTGMVSIIGGKLTTYRKMAADVVDVLVRRDGSHTPCKTENLVLAGGEDHATLRTQVLRTAEEFGLTASQAEHLYQTYGSGALRLIELTKEEPALRRPLVPGLPILAGEVVQGCREEQAVALADWLILRSRLAYLDRNHARGCAADVAGLMAHELGWSDAERAAQGRAFEEAITAELSFLREL